MPTPSPLHSSPGLQLRLVASQGQRVDAVFPLEAGMTVTLDQVLAASPLPVAEDQRAAARSCRVRGDGVLPGGSALWWFENGSGELLCRHNQQRIAQGERVRLSEGDVLEVGLARCEVELLEMPGDATGESPRMPTAPGSGIDSDAFPAFELTDLVSLGLDGQGGRGPMPVTDTAAHARAPTFIDALDRPLGDLVEASVPAGAPAPGALVSPAGPSVEPASEVHPEEPNALDELHDQYLRHVRSPHEPAAVEDWSLYSHAARTVDVRDALADLTQDAGAATDLYDLLGASVGIDHVLHGMDTLTDQDILAPDAHVDVLRLFAPADVLASRGGLPSLTRREHHRLTVDSAAQMDRKTTGPKAPIPPSKPE